MTNHNSDLNTLVMPLLKSLGISRPGRFDRIEINHHDALEEHPIKITLEFMMDISDPAGCWVRK